MQEQILHYLWKIKYFNTKALSTLSGKSIQILNNGFHNRFDGPDFLEAKILMDGIEWNGSIEFHIKTSDWLAHNHQGDKNYDNVILHLVYEHDKAIPFTFETIELKSYIEVDIIQKAEELLLSERTLPCQSMLKKVFPNPEIQFWMDKMLLGRYVLKAEYLTPLLLKCNGSFEQLFTRICVEMMGFKTHSDLLVQLFEIIPPKLLQEWIAKGEEEVYQRLLQCAGLESIDAELAYVLQKHLIQLPSLQWKKGSVRPQNQIQVRIEQLSTLLMNQAKLIQCMHNDEALESMHKLLKVLNLPKSVMEHILINVCIPFVLYWKKYHHADYEYSTDDLQVLQSLTYEQNHITQTFKVALEGIKLKRYHAQGFLYLHQQFCSKKKCLECAVGNAFLKS